MLNFQHLEKSKIKEYESYYSDPNAVGLEYNFVSAYLWSREYDIKVAFYDDTMIKAYFRDNGSVWGYCLPSGKNVKGAVGAVFADAKEKNERACFGYLSQKERDALEALCPERFVFERSDTTQDYIYFSDDLAYLAGKKYHSKRNHISKFFRTFGNTEVKSIAPENIGDAMTVVELWCEENGIDRESYAEYYVIREALDNLIEFAMRGIILYVERKPVAMTLGSEISPVCFDVNFEKALTAYDGSYAVINNEFAKRLTAYTYINREEDLGLEGLRKSKLSYHPAIIYDRYDGVAKW